MIPAPRLLDGRRRALAAVLVVLALGEAALAVLFAAALNQVIAQPSAPMMPLLGAAGIAVLAGAALLLGRWVGEDFAQSFVADCRTALFTAVTRQPNGSAASADARWLTVLINDLAALRNYALRGTVRLWTSVTATSAAALWAGLTMPQLRPALIPIVVGAGLIALLIWPLTRAIGSQRVLRGRLNRFLVRRVRAELGSVPATRGHGFRKLAALSGDLAQASVRRAAHAGTMDAAATLAGLAAALMVVWQTVSGADAVRGATGLAGSLMLLGFIAARLLESARALHARIGGAIAMQRLTVLLKAAPDAPARRARPRRSKHRPSARTGIRPVPLTQPQTHSQPVPKES